MRNILYLVFSRSCGIRTINISLTLIVIKGIRKDIEGLIKVPISRREPLGKTCVNLIDNDVAARNDEGHDYEVNETAAVCYVTVIGTFLAQNGEDVI